MSATRADLILHPVRLRLLAVLARRQLTARQLSARLPDVPQATLYHHLGLLTRAGLLRVVAARQVRGAVEKRYTLAADQAVVRPDDMAHASREDHLRYFTVFVATLLGDFARYLDQEAPIDLFADGAGYSETPCYLSDDELAQVGAAVRQALLPFLKQAPAPHRRRRLLAVITFPDAEIAESTDTSGDGGPAPPADPSNGREGSGRAVCPDAVAERHGTCQEHAWSMSEAFRRSLHLCPR